MNKKWFCLIIKELRDYLSRIDKIEEALGCVCEDMYKLQGVIIDYLEEQSGKKWPDIIYDDIYSHPNVSPETVWDKIENLD